EDTLNLLFLGNSHRVMGETPGNQASSRSHTVFTLAVGTSQRVAGNDGHYGNDSAGGGGDDEVEDEEGGGSGVAKRTILTRAELSLIDLAGSERMYKNDLHGFAAGLDGHFQPSGEPFDPPAQAQRSKLAAREREGKQINLSLHKLEKV
ncbi:unnamed protein product, partial [Discosporangium mesarthrocarpum]